MLSLVIDILCISIFYLLKRSHHKEALENIRTKLRVFRNTQLGFAITMTGVCFLPIFIPRVARNVMIIIGIFNFTGVNAAYTLIGKRKDDHYQSKMEEENIRNEMEQREYQKRKANVESTPLHRPLDISSGHLALDQSIELTPNMTSGGGSRDGSPFRGPMPSLRISEEPHNNGHSKSSTDVSPTTEKVIFNPFQPIVRESVDSGSVGSAGGSVGGGSPQETPL